MCHSDQIRPLQELHTAGALVLTVQMYTWTLSGEIELSVILILVTENTQNLDNLSQQVHVNVK